MKKNKSMMKIGTLSIVSIGLLMSISLVFKENHFPVYAENLANENAYVRDEDCTFMYVGKNVSESGLPIVARTGDSRTPLILHHVQNYTSNFYASEIMEGINGFKWQMPDSTYQFTGFPRSKCMGNSLHWNVSTMNECGVAISATLSCFSDSERVLKYDPFIKTGICEDNIAGLLAATSSSAKEAMLNLAQVIDKEGSAEANAVMSVDQQEAWYMEIYSGHQYCAIKLPDDKYTTIGNEFMLNTLADFSDESIIASKNLFSLPKEKGFAVFVGEEQDKNMHLFNTYARPLNKDTLEARIQTDGSHMRTWRGLNMFAVDSEQTNYVSDMKYPSFFTPKRKLTSNDVFTFFRDRYEDILNNPDSSYDIFREEQEMGVLRAVGTETSYQVHVMSVHPDLPKNMAVETWVAMGNATGAPFVPFNNAMTSFPYEYTNNLENYGFDDNCAQCIYRSISAIANINPEAYRLPVQSFWTSYENIWKTQYAECIQEAKNLVNNNKETNAKKLLSNICYNFQTTAIKEARNISNDLYMQYCIDQKEYKPNVLPFVPKTNIVDFAKLFGYRSRQREKILILKTDSKEIQIDLKEGQANQLAKISSPSGDKEMAISLYRGEYYGDYKVLHNLFTEDGGTLAKLDFDSIIHQSLEEKASNPILLLSIITILGVAIVGAVIVFFVLRKRKKASK